MLLVDMEANPPEGSESRPRSLTIGEVARRAGVAVDTVRFYERRGLVDEPPRRPSGYRQYPADAVERIHFIRHAQELGFSLHDIAELLALRVSPETSCTDVRRRAEEKLAHIDEKLRRLRRIRRALERLVAACRGRGPRSACPILEALAEEDPRARG